jgi:hypothetical protein
MEWSRVCPLHGGCQKNISERAWKAAFFLQPRPGGPSLRFSLTEDLGLPVLAEGAADSPHLRLRSSATISCYFSFDGLREDGMMCPRFVSADRRPQTAALAGGGKLTDNTERSGVVFPVRYRCDEASIADTAELGFHARSRFAS